MRLNYFMLCKKMVKNNILLIDEIISNFETMYHDCNEIEHSKNILRLREEYIIKKKEQIQLIEIYKDKIYKLCNHEFIDDEIDITPERTQKITYCTICESTKK